MCVVSPPLDTQLNLEHMGEKPKPAIECNLRSKFLGGLTVGLVVSSAYTAPKIEPIEQAGRGQVH